MGISGGLVLVALGAVLAFAVRVHPTWINLQSVGVILMLAGIAVLLVTFWYWQGRRRRAAAVQYQYQQYQRPRRGPTPPPPDAGKRGAPLATDQPSASNTDGT